MSLQSNNFYFIVTYSVKAEPEFLVNMLYIYIYIVFAQWDIFPEHNNSSLQLSETPGVDILKMWSTNFLSSKLTEILQNLYKFQFI